MRFFIKVIMVSLILLVICLSAIELVWGNWIHPSGLNQLNLLRNFDFVFDSSRLYPGGGKVHHRRDAYSLRGAYSEPSKSDILTLGGSATDQRYLY